MELKTLNYTSETFSKPTQLDEVKNSPILKELRKTLKFAKADRKEFDGREVSNSGKVTYPHKWQVTLGDKKIASIETAIKAMEEYEATLDAWSLKGSV